MKELYEAPELHEVGPAEIVIQGSKEVGTGDSGTAPFQHDVMDANDEDVYEVPAIREVGTADVVVRSTKELGPGDTEIAPYQLDAMAASEED